MNRRRIGVVVSEDENMVGRCPKLLPSSFQLHWAQKGHWKGRREIKLLLVVGFTLARAPDGPYY